MADLDANEDEPHTPASTVLVPAAPHAADGVGEGIIQVESPICGLYRSEKVQHILHSALDIAMQVGVSALEPSHLSGVDMLHYLGTEALEHFADRVAKLPRRPLQEEGPVCEEGGPIVVDIGAGVGGPARFLAHKWRCNVLAYEFNPDFCRAGEVLNCLVLRRGLGGCVRFVQGDFCEATTAHPHLTHSAHAFVSQLCFLHIADKRALYEQCAAVLQPGGVFLIEDFCLRRRPLGREGQWEQEAVILEQGIQVPDGGGLLTLEEYVAQLTAVGLRVESVEERSLEWASFVWARLEAFLHKHHTHTGGGGAAGSFVRSMRAFYVHVARAFPLPYYLHTNDPTRSHDDTAWRDPSTWSSLGFPHIARLATHPPSDLELAPQGAHPMDGTWMLRHVDAQAGPVAGGVCIIGYKPQK